MVLAHYTQYGFLIRSEEADFIEGEGTFTPLPDYDPETEIPRYLGGSDWIVLPLSARDEFAPPLPPGPDMPALRQQALATAMAYGNAITASEINQWAGVEPLSWTLQREEAKIVLAGGTLDEDAILPGLAEDKGVSLQAYAVDVKGNYERYQRVLRAAVSLRRTATTRLLDEALDTPEKLQAVVDELQVETDQLAARLLAADQADAAARAEAEAAEVEAQVETEAE